MSLTTLAKLILAQAEALESAYIASGQPLPSVFDLSKPESVERTAEYQRSSQVLIASASQLIVAVSPPEESIVREFAGFYSTAVLKFVVENSIASILHEHGTEGLDTQTLASKANVSDSSKLARALRYLATRHIFQEVRPNVFANNRTSTSLVSLNETGTSTTRSAIAAASSHFGGLAFQSALALPAFLESPHDSGPPSFHTTFGKSLFDYMSDPVNQAAAQDLHLSINAIFGARYPASIYSAAIKTLDLSDGALLVDVGGGSGSLVLSLAKDYPKLKYEVQDLPQVLEKTARPYLDEHLPDLLKSQTVTLRAHNFFEPQPVDNASVFMFRHTIHNWPTKDAIKILQHLRASAVLNKTRLVLFEIITPYCCKDTGKFAAVTNDPKVPQDLLPNLGIGKAGIQTILDIYMMAQLDSQVRTVLEFEELGFASGWKLDTVIPGPIGTLIYSVI